ncbi:cysteine dioxygenase family protein [Apibacter sp.]|uniref:cysteine dioxygenase n=1 Tax=Apibacter sp. TaxID=2023709 RepID=UPI0025D0DBAC|nr:cysteine dioxygenase family protein [Apibacter sp.]MCT6869917.1 cysteine dioxygenase family protein [Apibacter sp.]
METISKNKSEKLLTSIDNLKLNKSDYKQVASELFKYDFKDYDAAFNISEINVPEESYVRIPIYSDNCCAILMLWGINNKTAIHDHLNYDGLIKVLKGNLTEISYVEENNFIKYEGEGVASEGAIFPEDLGGIHSVVNNSPEISVSLHIYHTSQTSLKGVRIFDIENKMIGILNEKATSCSWNLPKDNFEKITKI